MKRVPNKFLLTLPVYLLVIVTFALDPVFLHLIDPFNFFVTMGTVIALNLLLWKIPNPLYLSVMLFLLFAEYGGMMLELYENVSWYDLAVHLGSGILLAFCGRYLCGLICRGKDADVTPWLPASFGLFFGIACAGLWEIYEFASDNILNRNSQLGSLTDTMGDMIAGSVGSLIGAGILLWMILKSVRKEKEN